MFDSRRSIGQLVNALRSLAPVIATPGSLVVAGLSRFGRWVGADIERVKLRSEYGAK